jgi:hypothetical protein
MKTKINMNMKIEITTDTYIHMLHKITSKYKKVSKNMPII